MRERKEEGEMDREEGKEGRWRVGRRERERERRESERESREIEGAVA